MTNLVAALAEEIRRNQELLNEYKKLPNGAGYFGAWIIQAGIDNAIKALESGDVTLIAQAYAGIKDTE